MEDKKFEEYLNQYSEKNQKIIYSGGMSTCGTLGVVFVTLKLLGYINWSWWWVTAPFWGPLVLFLSIFIVSLICIVPIAVYQSWRDIKNKHDNSEEKETTESITNDVNPFNKEGSLILNPNKDYILTPEFNNENHSDSFKCEDSLVIKEGLKEDKPKKKRSSKRKSKKNVEPNTSTETDSNK